MTGDRFRIFTKGVRKAIYPLAELITHELGHNWFGDQKIETRKVYGEGPARTLAEYNPRKARRSTENYSLFCAKAHAAKGLRTKRKGNFRAAD